MKKYISAGFFQLLLYLLCSSCANLKHINDFAAASLQAERGFETLPVSFQSLCRDSCKEADIKNGKLNPGKCDCTMRERADSVDYLFYRTVAAYLDGLARLSADEATSYKFDGLSGQLTGLGLSPAASGAYTKLGSILTKAITDGYRRNKIRLYIQEANGPLQVVIEHLRQNMGVSLSTGLKVNASKLESSYFDLFKKSRGDGFEQRKIIEEFYLRKAAIQTQLAALKAYAGLLQTIGNGHQRLAENVDILDKATLKDMISQYASNIKDIRAQIQILNKNGRD